LVDAARKLGAFYIRDRGHFDFARLCRLDIDPAVFLILLRTRSMRLWEFGLLA
jgi:hypothetical protein